MPAPGDIRNALVTLSDGDTVLKDLFQHRFVTDKSADLNGMAFGNLFIAALAQMTGSFERPSRSASASSKSGAGFFRLRYTAPTFVRNWRTGRGGRRGECQGGGKAPIARVFLKHDPIETSSECIDAILNADLITIGPGSLYTTVIACLLVQGIAGAIRRSPASVSTWPIPRHSPDRRMACRSRGTSPR